MSFSVKQAMGVIIALVCMSLIVVTARTLTVNNNNQAAEKTNSLWDAADAAGDTTAATDYNLYVVNKTVYHRPPDTNVLLSSSATLSPSPDEFNEFVKGATSYDLKGKKLELVESLSDTEETSIILDGTLIAKYNYSGIAPNSGIAPVNASMNFDYSTKVFEKGVLSDGKTFTGSEDDYFDYLMTHQDLTGTAYYSITPSSNLYIFDDIILVGPPMVLPPM